MLTNSPYRALNPSDLPFKKVAVLVGGASAEREISLMSGQGVLQALCSKGVHAHAFDPSERSLEHLRQDGFDVAFNVLHGRWGEDGTVQGALELLRIPYTGAGVLASALAIDKAMSKRIWQFEGLPTPAWQLLCANDTESIDAQALIEHLGLPMIVKPVREGSSLGLTKVESAQDVSAAIAKALALDSQILLESCICGPELTCFVLGEGEHTQAMPIIRIVVPGGDYDFESKYFSDATEYLIPSGLSDALEQDLGHMACQAYRALGCRGWGRIDLMLDEQTQQAYLLELNTTPGMTSHSLAPKSAQAAGLEYADLCMHILAQARLDYVVRNDAQGGVL